jgi:hypothetical protein
LQQRSQLNFKQVQVFYDWEASFRARALRMPAQTGGNGIEHNAAAREIAVDDLGGGHSLAPDRARTRSGVCMITTR